MGHHHHRHHRHRHRRHHHHHSSSTSKKQYDAKSIRLQKIVGICITVVGVVFLALGLLGVVKILSSEYLSAFICVGIVFLVLGVGYILNSRYLYNKLVINVVTCPDCGATNKVESKFCEKCGKTLRTTCPYCGAEMNGDNKICPQCGQSVEI